MSNDVERTQDRQSAAQAVPCNADGQGPVARAVLLVFDDEVRDRGKERILRVKWRRVKAVTRLGLHRKWGYDRYRLGGTRTCGTAVRTEHSLTFASLSVFLFSSFFLFFSLFFRSS